jgi:thioredoxin 1
MASHLTVAAPVSTPPVAASACILAQPRVVLRGLPQCRALRASARPNSRSAAILCQTQGGQDTAIEGMLFVPVLVTRLLGFR